MRKKHPLSVLYLIIAIISGLTAYPPGVRAADINTAAIMASSASPDCLEYRVVGICYWLFCTQFGCSVKTSTKVRHFIPELVVSSYNHQGQNPWTEMNMLSQGVSGGDYRTPHKTYTQMSFKNADAIGHPQGAISSLLNSTGYYCQSQTTPFVPYFLSGLDFFAWRENMPEMFYPEALIPGIREIGKLGDNWGNIYPRAGAVNQTHDYKAAAVNVQRVADIVSRMGQPHVYLPAAQQGGQGNWPPPPVMEGDKSTHKWQMLAPLMENTCAIFPNGEVTDTYSTQLSELGNYAWSLWRPYSCCKRRGQTFLFSVDWDTSSSSGSN